MCIPTEVDGATSTSTSVSRYNLKILPHLAVGRKVIQHSEPLSIL